MTSGDNNFSDRACPACGEKRGVTRGHKNDFRLCVCESCATLYTATLPHVGQSQDYDSYYTAENLTVPAFIDRRLDEIVATFERYRKNNRLLDVGCGGGSFLEAAGRNRWKAVGVEVSQTASGHVRGRGIEVFCGELEKANYADDHFDVVIASEVLEHVPDPRGMLEEIARVLRPGGLLWATTPHGRGISARLLGFKWSNVCPPEHLQLFSVAGIKGLLRDTGFSQVEVATHGTNPFEILHWLRGRAAGAAPENDSGESAGAAGFNRVESSYQLNEFMSDSSFRNFLKRTLNGLLNVMRMGDSLKIRAQK